jgi:hypothetical protein
MRIRLIAIIAVLVSVLGASASWAHHQPAPSSFTLAARGKVSQGVTVEPVLKKRRVIGLVVLKQPKLREVGTVLLGTFSGQPSIHWNLKVDGKRLSSGSYQIDLRVFANGKPTHIPGPRPRQLTISGQHVHVH